MKTCGAIKTCGIESLARAVSMRYLEEGLEEQRKQEEHPRVDGSAACPPPFSDPRDALRMHNERGDPENCGRHAGQTVDHIQGVDLTSLGINLLACMSV